MLLSSNIQLSQLESQPSPSVMDFATWGKSVTESKNIVRYSDLLGFGSSSFRWLKGAGFW